MKYSHYGIFERLPMVKKTSRYLLPTILELTLAVLGLTPPELESTRPLLGSTLVLHRRKISFCFYLPGLTPHLPGSTPSLVQHFHFLTFPAGVDSSPAGVDPGTARTNNTCARVDSNTEGVDSKTVQSVPFFLLTSVVDSKTVRVNSNTTKDQSALFCSTLKLKHIIF